MANELCVCNAGLGNTGLPSCEQIAKVIKKIIFVPLYSNAGVANKINPALTTNNLSWITALINNSDNSLRFFPTPEIKNIDMPKGDPVFEVYEDDSSNFVRESVRKFTGKLPKCPPSYKSKLESVRCNSGTGMYWIDIEGNVIGLTNNADGYLYPMPFNVQSLVAKVVIGNDKTTTGIDLMFEFPPSMKDANIRMIGEDNFPDFSWLDITGLVDAEQTVSSPTTTGFIVDVFVSNYGALNNPIAVEGLVAADFVSAGGTASRIQNVTDVSDVTVTSVTESATVPGRYTVAYTAQTSADVLTCRIKKNGYEIENATVTTP